MNSVSISPLHEVDLLFHVRNHSQRNNYGAKDDRRSVARTKLRRAKEFKKSRRVSASNIFEEEVLPVNTDQEIQNSALSPCEKKRRYRFFFFFFVCVFRDWIIGALTAFVSLVLELDVNSGF